MRRALDWWVSAQPPKPAGWVQGRKLVFEVMPQRKVKAMHPDRASHMQVGCRFYKGQSVHAGEARWPAGFIAPRAAPNLRLNLKNP